MKRIASVAIAAILSAAMGGGLLCESQAQAAYKQGLSITQPDTAVKPKMNQQRRGSNPSPSPSPTGSPRRR